MSTAELIYKVAPRDTVVDAEGSGAFVGMPIDERDGYIHFSTAGQLAQTLLLHFRGQRDLMLLAVRADALGNQLRWEPSRGGQLFPHLYGVLPMDAVLWSVPIAVNEDGTCDLPESVR